MSERSGTFNKTTVKYFMARKLWEENRLQTFGCWPSSAVVSPTRVAKAGFFSINRDFTVECFSCGLQISEWNYGDQVMTRHRMLSPACSFVLNPSTSGNVPSINPNHIENSINVVQSDATDSSSPNLLVNEAARLQSFENWPVPHIVTPESLARAGFYYLKHRDKTKCAYCNGVVVAWEIGDNPDMEHRRHFPNCSFVQNVINVRLNATEGESVNGVTNPVQDPSLANLSIVSQNNLQELGVNAHSAPKKRKYATLQSRLNTFTTWPEDLIQTPDALAQAGFYYEGSGDQVRCFHCDGGLRHWDPQDDPWTEHAKWFPKCAFVLLVKGQDFVRACAVDANIGDSNSEQRASSRPFQRREVTEREIQDQMMTPEVIAALNIGIHMGRIKKAITEKLEQTGTGFATVDAVIEAALNLQHEEDENSLNPNLSNQVRYLLSSAVYMSSNKQQRAKTEMDSSSNQSGTNSNDQAGVSHVEPPEKVVSLEEENRILKEARLCKICMDMEVGIVFLPCGHLATCVKCASNLQDCPVCRSSIKATVRTFLS